MKMPLLIAITSAIFVSAGFAQSAQEKALSPLPPFTYHPIDQRSEFSMSLDGTWRFKLGDLGDDIGRADFDDSSWSPITVPGNWELQGFERPAYGTKPLGSTDGCYRRTFTAPTAWQGRRMFVRFEGIAFGLELWIDGKRVGAFSSAFNRSEFDVTDYVKPGQPATIAVRVTRRDKGWEFDTNDDWSLSGIHREVTLFSLPETHLKDYTVTTPVSADGKEASVRLAGVIGRFGGNVAEATLNAKVTAADGAVAGSTSKRIDLRTSTSGVFDGEISIASPKLWNAETPNLYRLDLELVVGGQVVHQVSQRIGLRTISVDGGVFKLNGTPIKFRGVNHHDLSPDTGRWMSRDEYVKDLELMRSANINAVRMAHYPPNKVFLDLCDEYGMYVIDEVPLGFGEEHLSDDSYEPVLATRANATVARDKNQTSVLLWAVGNENPMTPMVVRTAGLVKALDPSRPRCLAHPKELYFKQPPAELDVISPHYLVSREAPIKMSSGSPFLEEAIDDPNIKSPILMTEFAHAAGTSLEDLAAAWAVMQKHHRFAGACIWHFQDQGIYRNVPAGLDPGLPKMTDAAPVQIGKVQAQAWVAADRVIDTNGPAGADGIVDADRFPQSDYFAVRKIYSPVVVGVDQLAVTPGRQTLSIPVENRYDFSDLSGVAGTWELHVDGRKVDGGALGLKAAARQSTTAMIAVDLPQRPGSHDLYLRLAFADRTGRSIVEHTVRLSPDAKKLAAAYAASLDRPTDHKIARLEQGTVITFVADRNRLTVDRESGAVRFGVDGQASPAFDGIALAVGRVPQMSEIRAYAHGDKPGFWEPYLLTTPTVKSVKVGDADDSRAVIELSLQFDRGFANERHAAERRKDGQAIIADVRLTLSAQGRLDIDYTLNSVNASDYLLEAGLVLKLHAAATRLTWLGNGPYPTYPAQPTSGDRGVYNVAPRPGFDPLNRMYPGNRADVAIAAATDSAGNGLGVIGENSTISLEPAGDVVYFRHLLRVAGHGQKRNRSLQIIKAAELKDVRGSFQVIPLVSEQWPETFKMLSQPGSRPLTNGNSSASGRAPVATGLRR